MKKVKKGFTLVELLVVIAILAILASVSVVGYMSFTNKAKESNDISLTTQMNLLLQANEVNGKNNTLTEARADLLEEGIDIERLPTSDGYSYVWDGAKDRIVLLNKENAVVAPENYTFTDDYAVFVIIRSAADFAKWDSTNHGYYFTESFEEATYSSEKLRGVDVGTSGIKTVSITDASSNGTITTYTNGGTLTVNTPNATVKHFGTADNVTIEAVASESYHLSGKIDDTLNVKQGHVVIEKSADAASIVVSGEQTGAVKIDNEGTIAALNIISASNDVEVNNSGSITTVVATEAQQGAIKGEKPTNSFSEVKTMTSDTYVITEGGYYDGTGVTIDSSKNANHVNYALDISTNENVIISGLTLVGKNGVNFGSENSIDPIGAYNVTFINSTFNVTSTAICVWYVNETDESVGSKITVRNCNFVNKDSAVTDYNTQTTSKTWGIFLNNTKGYTVDVANTNFYGYGYAILTNSYGTQHNMTINMNNCDIKGRAALDLLNLQDSTINVKNTKILGINTFKGPSEMFGNIVIDSGCLNNVLNVENCEFIIYRAPATVTNGQSALDIRTEYITINLIGNNTVRADVHYDDEKYFPETSDELFSVIRFKTKNSKVNGNFTSSVYNAICAGKTITLDWSLKHNEITESECFLYYDAANSSWSEYIDVKEVNGTGFGAFASECFMNGEAITLFNNDIVLDASGEFSKLASGHTFLINFNGYKINQENGATLVIPVGATIKTDSKTSVAALFSAKEGCQISETQEADETYTYKSVAIA